MSDVIKLGKKIVTIGVTFTTIVWSVIGSAFFALLPASAAECPADLTAGSMIKVTGAPAIYALNAKMEVLYFPTGDEFKSWNADDKYTGYKSVTVACYDSLKIPSAYPGGVNYRQGSYVVKRPSSPQLYVVVPGNALATTTPAVAKSLYGAAYKVMTVQDPFWPHYVNKGPAVTEAKPHEGMLVSNGGKTHYVDAGNTLREVTTTGFKENRFKTKFVHAVTSAMIGGYKTGDKIDAALPALVDRTQSGITITPPPPPPPTPVSGNLNVSLAADNPFAATVVSDTADGAQGMIPVLKLIFAASADGDVKVTDLKLKRGGISADTDISNMHLYDGDTRLASNPSVSNNVVTFTKTAGLFTVTKGTSKTVTVKLDLLNNVSSGKTMTFSLNAKEDVTAVAGTVAGTFPITGNIFTTASVTDLGLLNFSSSAPSAAGTVDPGTKQFEMWRLQAANSSQDIEIRKLTLTMVGSVSVGDLQNFSVWDGATQLGTTVVDMTSDKTVTFDLSKTPFLTTKGQTKIFSVKVDIVAGTNRTFRATIQNSWDIDTFDRNYSVTLKSDGTDTFTVIEPVTGTTAVNYTINTGTLTQSVASDNITGNVPDGATNVTLLKALWTANGEDIKVTQVTASSTISDRNANLTNTRLLVDGSQVGSTDASTNANGTSDSGWGTLGNSFIIPAGKTVSVTVVSDLTDTDFNAADTILFALEAGTNNAQGKVSLTNISTVLQTSNTLTVQSGTVTVTSNAAFGNKSAANPTGTVNATQVKVASFIVNGGAGEDVDMTQIVLADRTATFCIGAYMQNLTLKDASGKKISPTYPNPSSSCASVNTYTFNVSPSVAITKGGAVAVDVFADLKTATTTAYALIDVDSVTASGKTSGTDASSGTNVALQQQYISASGAFMAQADPDTPIAVNHLMGATDQIIAKFKVSASSTEAVNITRLVVSARFSANATGTLQNLRLVDDITGAQIGSAVPSFNDTVEGTDSATTTYSHATFAGLNLQIPAGVVKVLGLKVDFATYDANAAVFAVTGQTIVPVLLEKYTGTSGNNPFTATGASSGSSLTAVVSDTGAAAPQIAARGAYGATTTLYRAKLTTAWASDAPQGASSRNVAQQIAKFVVSNQANSGGYTATVGTINFDMSTSISQDTGVNTARTLTLYKDSLSSTALGTTSWEGRQMGSLMTSSTAITDAAFTDVEISSGASKTFFATFDTTDAATTESLSIRIPAEGVKWTDGVTTDIRVSGNSLPLQFKTFTY